MSAVSLDVLRARYQMRKKALDEATMRREFLRAEQQKLAETLAERKVRAEQLEKVTLLLRESSNYARERGRQLLEAMGSHILKHIYGPKYSMKIEIVEKKNRAPEAEIYVVKQVGNIEREMRPQNANGGGIVDMVSLGMRLAMLETHRPPLPGRTLILDEPGKHVSGGFVPAEAAFFATASKHFKRQLIVITHDEHVAETADALFRVAQDEHDVSHVTRIR